MYRTQVQLTEEQARALKERAARQGVSMAHLVREAVERFLERSGGIGAEERKRRAAEAAGRFRSGAQDVAEQHDRYLSEDFGSRDVG